eukprot:1146539-Pelagomonas_calceolata.AAC.1
MLGLATKGTAGARRQVFEAGLGGASHAYDPHKAERCKKRGMLECDPKLLCQEPSVCAHGSWETEAPLLSGSPCTKICERSQ